MTCTDVSRIIAKFARRAKFVYRVSRGKNIEDARRTVRGASF